MGYEQVEWPTTKFEPDEVVAFYARLLHQMPEKVENQAWAKVEGRGTIHFYTVLTGDTELRKRVYRAEQSVLKAYGSEYVVFDVFPDMDSFKPYAEHDLIPVAEYA